MVDNNSKAINGGAVYDPNNEYYDADKDLNTGRQKAVVMVGGVPKAVYTDTSEPSTSEQKVLLGTETETEKNIRLENEKQKEIKEVDSIIEINSKVTQLPDDNNVEEKIVSKKNIIGKNSKEIKRVE